LTPIVVNFTNTTSDRPDITFWDGEQGEYLINHNKNRRMKVELFRLMPNSKYVLAHTSCSFASGGPNADQQAFVTVPRSGTHRLILS